MAACWNPFYYVPLIKKGLHAIAMYPKIGPLILMMTFSHIFLRVWISEVFLSLSLMHLTLLLLTYTGVGVSHYNGLHGFCWCNNPQSKYTSIWTNYQCLFEGEFSFITRLWTYTRFMFVPISLIRNKKYCISCHKIGPCRIPCIIRHCVDCLPDPRWFSIQIILHTFEIFLKSVGLYQPLNCLFGIVYIYCVYILKSSIHFFSYFPEFFI